MDKMKTYTIAVRDERDYQDKTWGTKLDDEHTNTAWFVILGRYIGRVASTVLNLTNAETVESHTRSIGQLHRGLVIVGAVVQAWAESIQRGWPELFDEKEQE